MDRQNVQPLTVDADKKIRINKRQRDKIFSAFLVAMHTTKRASEPFLVDA